MDVPKLFFSWQYRNIKLIKTSFGWFNKILFDSNNFVGSICQIVQFTKKFGWNNQESEWMYQNFFFLDNTEILSWLKQVLVDSTKFCLIQIILLVQSTKLFNLQKKLVGTIKNPNGYTKTFFFLGNIEILSWLKKMLVDSTKFCLIQIILLVQSTKLLNLPKNLVGTIKNPNGYIKTFFFLGNIEILCWLKQILVDSTKFFFIKIIFLFQSTKLFNLPKNLVGTIKNSNGYTKT